MQGILFLTPFLIYQVILNFNCSFQTTKNKLPILSLHLKLCLNLNYSLQSQPTISLPKFWLTHVLPRSPLWLTLQNSNCFFTLHIFILSLMLFYKSSWSVFQVHVSDTLKKDLILKTCFICLLFKPLPEYRKIIKMLSDYVICILNEHIIWSSD